MGIEAWSTTAANNTSAPPNGAPEGMAPSSVNDIMRQQMADHRSQWNDAQWFQYGDGDAAVTITYVGAAQFRVDGVDVTGHYHVGRRVKASGSSTGTIYGTITASSFSTNTTVTVAWDSGSLANEALTIWTSVLSATNQAFPDRLFVGDSANAKMTRGITINQDGADNEILSLKSSDVAHGYTDIAETDTFGFVAKQLGASGGLTIVGLAETGQATGALHLQGYGAGTALDTGKSTSAGAGVEIAYGAHNGANAGQALAADGNVFGVVSSGTIGGGYRTLLLLDEDGDLHVDGSSSLTTFDAHDDALLVRAFDLTRDPEAQSVIRSEFDRFIENGREKLEEAGILGVVSDEDRAQGHRPLVNTTQLQRLHNGAIWQAYRRELAAYRVLEQLVPGFLSALQADLAETGMPALPLGQGDKPSKGARKALRKAAKKARRKA